MWLFHLSLFLYSLQSLLCVPPPPPRCHSLWNSLPLCLWLLLLHICTYMSLNRICSVALALLYIYDFRADPSITGLIPGEEFSSFLLLSACRSYGEVSPSMLPYLLVLYLFNCSSDPSSKKLLLGTDRNYSITQLIKIQRTGDQAMLSPVDTSTTQLVYLRIRDHHSRGVAKIVRARGPRNLLWDRVP